MADFERLVVKKRGHPGTLVRPVCRGCGWECPACGDLAGAYRAEAVHRGGCQRREIAPAIPTWWGDVMGGADT